jgi:hypothetical protein
MKKYLSMGSTNSRMHKQKIGGRHRRRTPPRPPNRRSWSSKDAGANHTSCARHHRRRPRLARSSEPHTPPMATIAAAEAYRVSCNRRRHRSWGVTHYNTCDLLWRSLYVTKPWIYVIVWNLWRLHDDNYFVTYHAWHCMICDVSCLFVINLVTYYLSS